MKKFLCVLLTVCLTFGVSGMLSSIAFADEAIIYVSPTGSDSNDGLTPENAKLTIQAGINTASIDGIISVAAGKYVGSINVSKRVSVIGAGSENTKIVASSGITNSLSFATSGATVSGFTITHEYTEAELSTWTFNNSGVNFSQNTSGNTLSDCTVTLNRNGIYLNNCQNNIITNNIISNNRTGINLTNNINGTQITGNTISSNWTLGMVFYSQSGIINFSTVAVSNNTFDRNWYTEILVKDEPNSTGTLDVSNNVFSDGPVTMSTSSDVSLNEPSFANQKPNVEGIGGTATKPEVDLPTLRIYNSGAVVLKAPAFNSQITPSIANFDKNAAYRADVLIDMDLGENTLVSISNGAQLTAGSQYSVANNTVTINKEYLATLAKGQAEFTFAFSAGSTATLTIIIIDTTAPVMSQGASFITDSYDGNDVTSANVLTNNGYIIYKLSDLQITSSTGSKYLIGSNDGRSYSVNLDYLDSSFDVIDSNVMNISGLKCERSASVPANALYVKINGVLGGSVYIFEITKNDFVTPPPVAAMSQGANNMQDGYDGNDCTSANILTDNGYIIYNLSDLQITSITDSKYIIGSNDSGSYTVGLDYLDSDLDVLSSSAINISGFKCDRIASVPADAVYVKINGVLGGSVYIYEISKNDSSTPTPVAALSQGANNIIDGYDGNDCTSANILTDNGYIIYKLSDLDITRITGSKYIIGSNDGGSYTVGLDYLDADLTVLSSGAISISGFKCEKTASVPADAVYVKINGTVGGFVYLYEISKNDSSTPNQVDALSQGANNMEDGYDGNDCTSANILTDDGYIIYELSDLQITSITGSKYIIGSNDGGSYTVGLDYLDENLTVLSSTAINISGFKCDRIASVPADAVYVKINGVLGGSVYIYEISKNDSSTPTPVAALSQGANNIIDGYDGNDCTSANILSNDGYIIYDLSDLDITSITGSKYIIGSNDGGSYTVGLDYLDADLDVLSSSAISISGFKCEKTASVPADAVYVKINGTVGGSIYIYEITANNGPVVTPSASMSQGANNLNDGYDGNDCTSANILTDDGYIIYKLSDIGLSGATSSAYIIGSNDGRNYSVSVQYLDADFDEIGSSTLNVSGFKCEQIASIPVGTVYVQINGTVGGQIYIYEIGVN